MARGLAAVLLLLMPLAACGGGDDTATGGELTVLAAASLTDVYDELAQEFEDETGAAVTFSFGSSTDLAQQAADGAPGDVLATADQAAMEIAVDAGVTGEVTEFARNVPVLVTPPDNPAGIQGLADLAGATWVRCADAAPCGRVARDVLDANGITARPASLEDDVRATLDKVTSGEADAGLVYASDAVAAGDGVTTIEIPGADEQRTSYFLAPLEQAADRDLARRWIELVTGEAGRSALEDNGFTLP